MSKKPAKVASANSKSKSKTPKAKSGLRLAQVRVLRALKASRPPLSRAQLAEKTGISVAMVVPALNGADGSNPRVGEFPGLVAGKFVECHTADDNGTMSYEITDKGRKTLEAHELGKGALPEVRTGPSAEQLASARAAKVKPAKSPRKAKAAK